MMTECLVYYIAPGVTVLGSDVDEGLQRGEGGESITGIPLVGQSIAPKHCRITRGESGSEVVIEAIEGAVTFVNGRCALFISLTHKDSLIHPLTVCVSVFVAHNLRYLAWIYRCGAFPFPSSMQIRKVVWQFGIKAVI